MLSLNTGSHACVLVLLRAPDRAHDSPLFISAYAISLYRRNHHILSPCSTFCLYSRGSSVIIRSTFRQNIDTAMVRCSSVATKAHAARANSLHSKHPSERTNDHDRDNDKCLGLHHNTSQYDWNIAGFVSRAVCLLQTCLQTTRFGQDVLVSWAIVVLFTAIACAY